MLDVSAPSAGTFSAAPSTVGTPPKTPLTKTTGLSPAEGLKLEDEMINRSIAYARKNLSL